MIEFGLLHLLTMAQYGLLAAQRIQFLLLSFAIILFYGISFNSINVIKYSKRVLADVI